MTNLILSLFLPTYFVSSFFFFFQKLMFLNFYFVLELDGAFQVALVIKNPPANAGDIINP